MTNDQQMEDRAKSDALIEKAKEFWDREYPNSKSNGWRVMADFAAAELAQAEARVKESERDAMLLNAKIQLLREIHATALDQFGKDRGIHRSVNSYVGNLVRLRETELTKEQFNAALADAAGEEG